jgi:SP family myo-inositol transporter-like MFS transporter 13
MYYSASLFQEIGFNQPTAVGLIVSGTNFIFTLFALKYIDIVGRRRIMVFSAPGMVFGLTLASIAFHCMFSIHCTMSQMMDLDLVDMTLHTGGDLVNGVSYSRSWSAIVLLSMIIFVASYATGLGNVPWQQGELFGLEGRIIVSSTCEFSADILCSPWYRHIALDCDKLGWQPSHRLYISLSHGEN